MKTVIRISNDYDSNESYFQWREDINCIVNDNGLDVHCEISNTRFINVVEEEKNYAFIGSSKENYKNMVVVNARGYSQGDWQEYKLYHNCYKDDKPLKELVDLLTKTFTHQNDYLVETFKKVTVDGEDFLSEESEDFTMSIRWEEFPDKEDILSELKSHGIEYDEIEFNIK